MSLFCLCCGERETDGELCDICIGTRDGDISTLRAQLAKTSLELAVAHLQLADNRRELDTMLAAKLKVRGERDRLLRAVQALKGAVLIQTALFWQWRNLATKLRHGNLYYRYPHPLWIRMKKIKAALAGKEWNCACRRCRAKDGAR